MQQPHFALNQHRRRSNECVCTRIWVTLELGNRYEMREKKEPTIPKQTITI